MIVRTRTTALRYSCCLSLPALLAMGCPQDPDNTTTGTPDTTTGSDVGESGNTSVPSSSIGDDSTSGPAETTSTSSTGGTGSTGSTGEPDSTGSTGSTSGTGSTSAGETSSVDTTLDTTTTTTGDTTGDESGDPDPTDGNVAFACCDQGCSAKLLQTLVGDVDVSRSGDRITAISNGVLLLWDAATLTQIARYDASAAQPLVGDRLLYSDGGQLHLVDATDGSEIGVMPAAASWGLAADGGYVWVADNAGLRVHEPDGALRWQVAGLYASPTVQATAGTLHVYDKDVMANTVQRFTAADGAVASSVFIGSSMFFNFGDSGRYRTLKDQTYRIYDEDGTVLATGNDGYPGYGWGDRYEFFFTMFGQSQLRDVTMPNVVLEVLPTEAILARQGPLLFSRDVDDDYVRVLHLDQDPFPPPQFIALPEGYGKELSFSMGGDGWIAGTESGKSIDHLGRKPTFGPIRTLAGAQTGRAVVAADAKLHILDLAEDCGLTAHPALPNPDQTAGLRLAADGSTLMSIEKLAIGLEYPKPGTRIYSLPGGEKLYEQNLGLMSNTVHDHDISDDGTRWSRYWSNTFPGGTVHAETLPLTTPLETLSSDVLPKLAPGGAHYVMSDGIHGNFDTWAGDPSWIYLAEEEFDDPIVTFDGISHGFLDDEHILVGTYVAPNDKFVGNRIVDLAGLDVQDTPLPEIRRLFRVGTGEILGFDYVAKRWKIFEPWTGAVLWTGPTNVEVTIAGPNLVLLNRGDHVEATLWR